MRTISDDVLELRLLVVEASDRGAYEEVRSIRFELAPAPAISILTAGAEEGETRGELDDDEGEEVEEDEEEEVEVDAGALAAAAAASAASITISWATRELTTGWLVGTLNSTNVNSCMSRPQKARSS